jgi:hypothetical protein
MPAETVEQLRDDDYVLLEASYIWRGGMDRRRASYHLLTCHRRNCKSLIRSINWTGKCQV